MINPSKGSLIHYKTIHSILFSFYYHKIDEFKLYLFSLFPPSCFLLIASFFLSQINTPFLLRLYEKSNLFFSLPLTFLVSPNEF